MIFPTYDKVSEKIVDGDIFKADNFCHKLKQECLDYYNSLNGDGIYSCPRGFSVIVKSGYIMTSIGIKGYCDSVKLRNRGYTQRLLEKDEAKEIAELYSENLNKKVELTFSNRIITELVHDVRNLNRIIKQNCEELLDNLGEKERGIALNVLTGSNLLTKRMDYFRYLNNPSSPMFQREFRLYRLL